MISRVSPNATRLRIAAAIFLVSLLSSCQSPQEGVAEIVLSGSIGDQSVPASGSPRGRPQGLRNTLQLFHELSQDDEVSGVLVRLGTLDGGPARCGEVRDGLRRLTESGRTVHCQLENATNYTYWLAASSCERIAMSPAGSLDFIGLATESYYIYELLESIGAEPDFLQVGTHKGAAEFLTHEEMSPETRETLEMMLDDLTTLLTTDVGGGRELEPGHVRELMDEAPLDPQRALELGLIDAIEYHDQSIETLQEAIPGEAPVLSRYLPRRSANQSPGLLDVLASQPPSPPRGPRVAVLYLTGPIVSSGSGSSLLGEQITIGQVRRALNAIREDENIRALVIRIDSPGGSASVSDEIWHEIISFRGERPIVASMGDVAASGGYYIAAAADEILAQPGTITGSIGVVGGKVVFTDLLERAGVNPVLLSRGRNAGLTSLARPFSPSQTEAIQRLMQSIYDRFVHCLVEGRGMSEEQIRPLATGQPWTGQRALELGLVDSLGGLHEAIALARELASLEENAPVEAFPKPLPLLQQIERMMSTPSLVLSPEIVGAHPDLTGAAGEALSLALMFQDEPVLTYWPVHVSIE